MSLSILRSITLGSLRTSHINNRMIHIPSENREKITRVFLQTQLTPYHFDNNFKYLMSFATKVLKNHLPSHVTDSILSVKKSEVGFVEITGTPEDPVLMDTPTSLKQVYENKKTFLPELFSMGIAGILNQEIFNYRQEAWGTGALIFNIFPKPDMLSIKGAGGTKEGFGFHVENAWHSQSPNYLILKGLRQDHDAAAITYAVANRSIYNELTLEEKEILKNHIFRICPPEIHRKMEKEKGIIFSEVDDYLGPVAIEEKDGIKMYINFNGMRAETGDVQDQLILTKVENLALKLSQQFKLCSDSLLLINNHRAIHTRNGYTPRFDGKDRWLQRYYLIDSHNLWRCKQIQKSQFNFLSPLEIKELFKSLRKQKILNGNFLTSKFCPHDPAFTLILPKSLEAKKTDILRVLIKIGPSAPHRVI